MWGFRGAVNSQLRGPPDRRRIVNSRSRSYNVPLKTTPMWGTRRIVNSRLRRSPDHRRVVNSRPRGYNVTL